MVNRRTALVISIAALVLAFASTALAGKSSPSSISLHLLGNSVAASAPTANAHWGDSVTFDVATTATDKPSVMTTCYQGATLVYRQFGFFYPAPTSPTFTLHSYVWQ